MPRQDIEFKTTDQQITLRGDLFTPNGHDASVKLPCLIMVHGWSCVKEMELPKIAEALIAKLPIAVMIYDHRGFGSSDTGVNAPRREVVPSEQCEDLSDAVSYASTLEVVDAERIGVWGYSFGGGAALTAAAVDTRIRVAIGLAPHNAGWKTRFAHGACFSRRELQAFLDADRLARFTNPGAEVVRVPVVKTDPAGMASINSKDGDAWFAKWEGKGTWVNDTTLRSFYFLTYAESAGYVQFISPRAVLFIVPEYDTESPPEIQTETFERAREPKRLELLHRTSHFDVFDGAAFEKQLKVTVEFLTEQLIA